MISQAVITVIREGKGLPSHAAEVLDAYEGLVKALEEMQRIGDMYDIYECKFPAEEALAQYGIEDST